MFQTGTETDKCAARTHTHALGEMEAGRNTDRHARVLATVDAVLGICGCFWLVQL